MEGGGKSDKWADYKGNVGRIWELFRTSTTERNERYPTSWDKMTEAELCCPSPYNEFTEYLVHEYIQETGQNKGELLRISSVLGYLGCLINLASTKFKAKGNPQTLLFLTCLDSKSSTEHAMWLRGLRKNVTRELFQRTIEQGDPLDDTEIPVYLNDIRAMVFLWINFIIKISFSSPLTTDQGVFTRGLTRSSHENSCAYISLAGCGKDR